MLSIWAVVGLDCGYVSCHNQLCVVWQIHDLSKIGAASRNVFSCCFIKPRWDKNVLLSECFEIKYNISLIRRFNHRESQWFGVGWQLGKSARPPGYIPGLIKSHRANTVSSPLDIHYRSFYFCEVFKQVTSHAISLD